MIKKNKVSLYELTTQYAHLQERLDAGEDPEFITDTLEGLDGSIQKKCENIVYVMKNIEVPLPAIDKEISRLKEKKDAIQNNMKRLKEYLKEGMGTANITEIKTDLLKILLQNSPPKIEVLNQGDIPEDYIITEIIKTIDKNKAAEVLKKGGTIAGLTLVRNKHIRIY